MLTQFLVIPDITKQLISHYGLLRLWKQFIIVNFIFFFSKIEQFSIFTLQLDLVNGKFNNFGIAVSSKVFSCSFIVLLKLFHWETCELWRRWEKYESEDYWMITQEMKSKRSDIKLWNVSIKKRLLCIYASIAAFFWHAEAIFLLLFVPKKKTFSISSS